MKTGLLILLLMLLILLVPGSAQALTITWTTTADFDGGTKTSSGGNFEIETNTDNLGIATGGFELSSLKGDSFTLADTDADTFKWNLMTGTSTCTGTSTRSIAGGVLDVDVTCTSVNDRRTGVLSSATITGDWDVRIKVDKTVDLGTTSIWELSLFTGTDDFCTGTNDGLHYRDIDGALQAYTCVNSAFVQVGTNTVTPSDPIWLRITRATNTFTFFYSTDGSAWTQDETTTNANIANPLYGYFSVFADGPSGDATGADFDDFYVAAGTVNAGGFRTTGMWTSATQIYSGEVAASITITYSGASASNYIDAVRIVDSAGSVLFTDDTDRTSGTSATSTIPFVPALQADWGVRILLAGGGAGTSISEAVSVETGSPPAGSESAPKGFPGFAISCTSQLNVLSCMLGFPPPAPAGIEILETQWYVDGSFQGRGRALDPQRQEIELRSSWTLAIYRGAANVTVLVLLSNGQQLRQSRILDVDNSWVTLLLIVGSVAGTSLILLQAMGKLEIHRKRVQDRKDRRTKGKEENWRWQLFEQK